MAGIRSSRLARHLLALAAILAGVGCARSAPQAEQSATVAGPNGQVTIPQDSPLRSALGFDTARSVPVSDLVLASASVESEASRTVKLYPPLTGRVVAVQVQIGDAVNKGQPLLTLDSPDFTSAQADYSHSTTALHQASNALGRQRDLAQYGIAAQRDVEQAETDFSQAEGDYRRAAAHLLLLGIDTATALKDRALQIRSPIAGRVIDLDVGLGEFRNDPTVPVMTVADLDSVWLTANVSEKDLHVAKLGDRAIAVFNAFPTDTVRGVVSMVGDVVDTATRMTKVRVTLSNPGQRFKPGMYATVTLAGKPTARVVVPATAVLQIRDSNFVFVETQPWTLRRQPVTVGRLVGDRVIVQAGLSSGQRVVTRQVVLLQ